VYAAIAGFAADLPRFDGDAGTVLGDFGIDSRVRSPALSEPSVVSDG